MRTFLWILVVLNELFILCIGSLKLSQFEVSEFTLQTKLAQLSTAKAKRYRQLHRVLAEIKLLQIVELTLASMVLAVLLSHLNRPLLGLLYAVISLFFITLLSRLSYIQKQATKLFEATLDIVLKTVKHLRPLWVIIGIPEIKPLAQPTSQEEFRDQLRRLPSTVLNPQQRQRLEMVLASEQKTVKDIFTPRRRVLSIEPSSTLGPILLSDLQKSGHGYFPVMTKKGEPQGLLTLSDVTDIHTAKTHQLVRDLMNTQMAWVEEATSLPELMQVFLGQKQYFVFVRDLEAQFSGIVTFADVMKHTLGIVKD